MLKDLHCRTPIKVKSPLISMAIPYHHPGLEGLWLQMTSIAKDSLISSTIKNSVFAYVVGIYLTSSGLNNDVKLTKFGTTGPSTTDRQTK